MNRKYAFFSPPTQNPWRDVSEATVFGISLEPGRMRFVLSICAWLFPLPPLPFAPTCQVEEVYSILNAVKILPEIIEITAPNAMQLLVLLTTGSLEPTSPLTVKHVPLVGQKEERCPPSEERRTVLAETGEATRLAFHTVIAKRVVEPRYGKGLDKYIHLFDIGMMLNTIARSPKYPELLKSSTFGKAGNFVADPSAMKARVEAQFTGRSIGPGKMNSRRSQGCGYRRVGVEAAQGLHRRRRDKASSGGTVEERRHVRQRPRQRRRYLFCLTSPGKRNQSPFKEMTRG